MDACIRKCWAAPKGTRRVRLVRIHRATRAAGLEGGLHHVGLQESYNSDCVGRHTVYEIAYLDAISGKRISTESGTLVLHAEDVQRTWEKQLQIWKGVIPPNKALDTKQAAEAAAARRLCSVMGLTEPTCIGDGVFAYTGPLTPVQLKAFGSMVSRGTVVVTGVRINITDELVEFLLNEVPTDAADAS